MEERPDPLAEPEGYRAKPGQHEWPPPSGCGAENNTCGGLRACYRLWIGDINEHVWPLDLCARHAWQHVQSGLPLRCTVCKAGAQIIRIEGFHGHESADLMAEGLKRVQAALDWAGLNPARGHGEAR